MPLGTIVGLGPGNIVLDGDPAKIILFHFRRGSMQQNNFILTWNQGFSCGPAPPSKGHSPQISAHVCCGQTAGWNEDATWYKDRAWPMPHCVTWGLNSPLPKWTQPPIFGPCLLWPNGCPSQLLLSTCYYSRCV